MAERHLKMTLRPLDGGPQLTALAFYWEDEGEGIPHAGQHLALVYRLDVNEYLGQRTLQLLVQRMRRL